MEIAMQHVVPEDRPIVTEAYAHLEETGTLAHENRIIWPDGSIHWIAVQGKVHYTSDGRADRITGVVADITDRKTIETALARLSSFPERNPTPIIEIDAGGHILYCNPGAARLFPDLKVNDHPFLSGLGTVFDTPAGEIPELRSGRSGQATGVTSRPSVTYPISTVYVSMAWTSLSSSRRKRHSGRAGTRLKTDLAAMNMLQKIGMLYIHQGNLKPVLTEIVETAVAITGADFGNIQLLDPCHPISGSQPITGSRTGGWTTGTPSGKGRERAGPHSHGESG